MKRMLSLVTALMMLMCACSALAEGNGAILDYLSDFSNLYVYAAVNQSYRTTLSFTVSVDNSEEVPVIHSALPSSNIGHLIVVDTSMPYCNSNTKWLTYENAYLPILQKYLSVIGNGERIRFIIAGTGGSYTETDWMMNNQAQDFIRYGIKLEDKAGGTSINRAISQAFAEAQSVEPGAPLFKNVFALVDADSTNDGDSLSNGSGRFPFFLVTIAQTGTNSTNKKTDALSNSFSSYKNFAAGNNGTYIELSHTGKGEIDCSSLTSQVTQVLNNLQYYTLDLNAAYPKIDYTQNQHRFTVIGYSSDGSQQASMITVENSVLPPSPVPTEAPTPEPTPDLGPTDTPEPTPVVAREANDSNALKVISRLWELYYLEERTNTFDDTCRYAFMEFCRNNGLEEQDTVDTEAFNLLMFGNPVPKATATPSPSPSPTPVEVTPSPVPKAYPGSTSTSTFYVIKQLQKLYYLDPNESHTEFDSSCMNAFLDFCIDNGISYDKDYIDDDTYQFLMSVTTPKETPTPEPVETPTPQPTVPAQGYGMGDTDPAGADFISSMQSILAALNLYAAEYTPGLVEQSTIDAAMRYCEEYGLLNSSGANMISQQIVNDVLTKGASRTPYVEPDPSAGEQLAAMLQRDVFSLGTFAVKMWMIILLILVLLFVILLIIILMRHKKPDDDGDEEEEEKPRPSGGDSGRTDEVTRPTGGGSSRMDNNTESTTPLGKALRVTFTVTSGGRTWNDNRMITGDDFIIGRGSNCNLCTDESDKSVSRKHAALFSRKGALYIRDLSTYQTTWVNGVSVSKGTGASAGEMTTPVIKNQGGANDGYELSSGDEITLGENCRIKVVW